MVGMCDATASSFAPLRCASNRPWTKWVLPGPQDAPQTASSSAARESAPAANAAASSLRTCTHSMSLWRTASDSGLSESPTRP